MKKIRALVLMLLGTACSLALAEQSIRLYVSATIPPQPCEYPDRCQPVESTALTKVSVEQGVIRYVGSPPAISQQGDLLTVIF